MKNILHLGSSWSEVNGVPNHSLPFFVTEGLINRGIDVNYYSTAMGGCGLGVQFEILLNILNGKEKIDFVLFEVTTFDRFHCQLLDSDIVWEKEDSHPNIVQCRNWLIKNYIFWMPLHKEIINQHWPYLSNKGTYLKMAKLLNAGDFNWESIFLSRIVTIKNLLKKRNIPFLIYAHDSKQMVDKTRISQLTLKEIYDELDFCVNEYIGIETFKKFAIDRGFHMSSNGDRYIAENVLIPKIIRIKYPELSESEVEELRQHVVVDSVIKNGEIKQVGDKRFVRMADQFINIDDLHIDLIDKVNPFQKAFEVLSKSVTARLLKVIGETIESQRIAMTDEEAVILYKDKITLFIKKNNRQPDINSNDPLERRMAEAIVYLKNKARQLKNTN